MNWNEIVALAEEMGIDATDYWWEEPKSLKEIIVLMEDYDKEKTITHETDPENAFKDYCFANCEWERRLCEMDFQRYIDELKDEYEGRDE